MAFMPPKKTTDADDHWRRSDATPDEYISHSFLFFAKDFLVPHVDRVRPVDHAIIHHRL